MSIFYNIQKILLQGKENYYLRWNAKGKVDLRQIAGEVGEQTSMHALDLLSAVQNMLPFISKHLAEGKSVVLGDLLSINLSMSAKEGVEISPSFVARLEDIDIHININPRNGLKKDFMSLLYAQDQPLVKLSSDSFAPVVLEVVDLSSKKHGVYSAGMPLSLQGHGFDLGSEPAAGTGVFFAMADGSELHSEVYINSQHELISCMVPAALSGPAKVIVRQYSGKGLLESTPLEIQPEQ